MTGVVAPARGGTGATAGKPKGMTADSLTKFPLSPHSPEALRHAYIAAFEGGWAGVDGENDSAGPVNNAGEDRHVVPVIPRVQIFGEFEFDPESGVLEDKDPRRSKLCASFRAQIGNPVVVPQTPHVPARWARGDCPGFGYLAGLRC